jgi:hypothetical protein
LSGSHDGIHIMTRQLDNQGATAVSFSITLGQSTRSNLLVTVQQQQVGLSRR